MLFSSRHNISSWTSNRVWIVDFLYDYSFASVHGYPLSVFQSIRLTCTPDHLISVVIRIP